MTDAAQTAQFRAATPSAAPKAGTRISRRKLKRTALALGVIGSVFAAGDYGHYYWTTGRYLVSTDDAYVDVHSAIISPKISGYISDVPVNDNQHVKAGDVIARIDPRDYQTALDQARANVAGAQATIDTLTQQIAQQHLVVEQIRQQVASDQAALLYSQQDYQRYTELERTGYGTVQRAQQAQSDIVQKQAKLDSDKVGVASAEKQVAVLTAELEQACAALGQQQASEHQAELNLSYTTIAAPFDGTIGVRNIQVGQYVQPGTQLMAVVPPILFSNDARAVARCRVISTLLGVCVLFD
jgi:membrane fusion protein (multidrug efflux system)